MNDIKDDSSFIISILDGNIEQVNKYFDQKKIDLRQKSSLNLPALICAIFAYQSKLQIIEILLNNNADFLANYEDGTVLHYLVFLSIILHEYEIIELLLRNGAQDAIQQVKNDNKLTPYEIACKIGEKNFIDSIIKKSNPIESIPHCNFFLTIDLLKKDKKVSESENLVVELAKEDKRDLQSENTAIELVREGKKDPQSENSDIIGEYEVMPGISRFCSIL